VVPVLVGAGVEVRVGVDVRSGAAGTVGNAVQVDVVLAVGLGGAVATAAREVGVGVAWQPARMLGSRRTINHNVTPMALL